MKSGKGPGGAKAGASASGGNAPAKQVQKAKAIGGD